MDDTFIEIVICPESLRQVANTEEQSVWKYPFID